jgi:hypothetical protein
MEIRDAFVLDQGIYRCAYKLADFACAPSSSFELAEIPVERSTDVVATARLPSLETVAGWA